MRKQRTVRFMPAGYLCFCSEENWRTIKQRGVWGVSERVKGYVEGLKVGDILFFFVRGTPTLAGACRVTSEPFVERTKLFNGGEYPHRVKVRLVDLEKSGRQEGFRIGSFLLGHSEGVMSILMSRVMLPVECENVQDARLVAILGNTG